MSLEKPPTDLQSSRRNLIRMGAIVASAVLLKATAASADDSRWERHDDWDRDRRDHRCFLKGTTIRTIDGDRRIEDLAVGDLLPTVFGGTSAIQWVGRYRFRRSDPAK